MSKNVIVGIYFCQILSVKKTTKEDKNLIYGTKFNNNDWKDVFFLKRSPPKKWMKK